MSFRRRRDREQDRPKSFPSNRPKSSNKGVKLDTDFLLHLITSQEQRMEGGLENYLAAVATCRAQLLCAHFAPNPSKNASSDSVFLAVPEPPRDRADGIRGGGGEPPPPTYEEAEALLGAAGGVPPPISIRIDAPDDAPLETPVDAPHEVSQAPVEPSTEVPAEAEPLIHATVELDNATMEARIEAKVAQYARECEIDLCLFDYDVLTAALALTGISHSAQAVAGTSAGASQNAGGATASGTAANNAAENAAESAKNAAEVGNNATGTETISVAEAASLTYPVQEDPLESYTHFPLPDPDDSYIHDFEDDDDEDDEDELEEDEEGENETLSFSNMLYVQQWWEEALADSEHKNINSASDSIDSPHTSDSDTE